METSLRLTCVLAHPDDESLGTGGALATCAREGVETYLVTATRGERGRFGTATERPAPSVVGRVREAELRAAAQVLGVRDVRLLDYGDGDLDRFIAWSAGKWAAYQAALKRLQVTVDDTVR
jgi:LmbE family N-acetylglucosaminyl deacetylase